MESEQRDVQSLVANAWHPYVGSVTEEDNFFVAGGTSLHVVQVSMELSRALGITIRPAMLFENPKFGAYVTAVQELIRLETERSNENVGAGRVAFEKVRSASPVTTTRDRLWACSGKDQVTWLRAVQSSNDAFMVVPDQIGADGRRSRTATDTLSVVRAHKFLGDTSRVLPPELIRRDASPAGLRKSLAARRELQRRQSLPL
ncbi:MAG TPA: phosphopantetheine-binding protein [Streptosporangiaceae bacterium]|nr:phosphopantetheine-binding protein [Streptosporangiaceae bacterium]